MTVYAFHPEQVSQVTGVEFEDQSRLFHLVNTDITKDFASGKGDTVTIRTGTVLSDAEIYNDTRRRNGEEISFDSIADTVQTVRISDMAVKGVKLPSETLTFDIYDLNKQVIKPMVKVVSKKVNETIVNAINTVDFGLTKADTAGTSKIISNKGNLYDKVDDVFAAGETPVSMGANVTIKQANLEAKTHEDVRPVIRYAETVLNQRGVDYAGRILLVGSLWAQAIASDPLLQRVDASGTREVLTSSTIGRLNNFTVVHDPAIGPTDAFAFHRDAIGAAVVKPDGWGHDFSVDVRGPGYSMYYHHSSDVRSVQALASLHAFVGAEVLNPQLVLRLKGKEGIEEPTRGTTTVSAPAA